MKRKRGRGRPPLAKRHKRQVVSMRFSREEMAALEKAAKLEDKPFRTWARDCLLTKARGLLG